MFLISNHTDSPARKLHRQYESGTLCGAAASSMMVPPTEEELANHAICGDCNKIHTVAINYSNKLIVSYPENISYVPQETFSFSQITDKEYEKKLTTWEVQVLRLIIDHPHNVSVKLREVVKEALDYGLSHTKK